MRMVLHTLIEVLFGMEYLHSVGIVHEDLKCAKVLCASKRLDLLDFTCKIFEFWLSGSQGSIGYHCKSPKEWSI